MKKQILLVAVLIFTLAFSGKSYGQVPYARMEYTVDPGRSYYWNANENYTAYIPSVSFWADAACTTPWTGGSPSIINISLYEQFNCQSVHLLEQRTQSISDFITMTSYYYYYADFYRQVLPGTGQFDTATWFVLEPSDDYIPVDGPHPQSCN